MSKLLKILKSSSAYILLIIALLIVQAMCDLSLPAYTSDIVNTGITQNGIKSNVPSVIRKVQLDRLLLFLSDEDAKTVKDAYVFAQTGSDEYNLQKKAYPNLVNEPLYILKANITEDEKNTISKILQQPQIITYTMESGEFSSGNTFGTSSGSTSGMFPKIPEGKTLFDLLQEMPKAQAKNIINSINSSAEKLLSVLDDSTKNQRAIQYTKSEYENLGIKISSIQNRYIIKTGLKMLALSALSMAAAILISLFSSRVSAKCGYDLRDLVFSKVLKFTNREFDEFSTASLITRCTNDIQQVQMFLVIMLRMVFYAPIIGIGAFVKVLNSSNSMSWVIGVAVASILSLVITIMSIAIPKFQLLQKLVDKVNLVSREILTGLPVIRAFTSERREEKRFDDANLELTRTNLFVSRVMAFMMPLMTFIMNGISVLIIWAGAKNIDAGKLMIGDLMAFIQYTMQIIMAFLMLSFTSIMIPRAAVSMKRIAEVLDKKISITDPETENSFDESKKGTVEFRDVYFRYPGAEEDVLRNISFIAKPGETTAFIGSTGSGKSTLINLIPRFFDVTAGKILIDGVDIRTVSQKKLREKIGYVPQKGVLFSGTIASNIAFGNPDMDKSDIVTAARIAQAEEFIEAKPAKYDSEISQGGTNVSGGQKQRLSIARAIAKKPEILIFDDSFSALDFKTDAALRKALARATAQSTVFIVAQRISTVINADRIIVLDNGEIAGIGTHKELLDSCEVYQQIASSQLSPEELKS